MRKSVRGIIATLLVFVLAVGTGSAQTPRTEMKLTIEEAINWVWQRCGLQTGRWTQIAQVRQSRPRRAT